MVLRIIITALVCYFLGNHNGAICVSLMLGDDVRSHGSGNAGLTNFIRNFGANRAALVIAIDVLKAILACLLGGLMFPEYAIAGRTLGGVAVMLGHDFPALQGFRGGKGILSGWFIAFMIDWRIGVLIGIVFFTTYLLTQYVSLGSVLAAFTFALGFIIFRRHDFLVMVGGVFMGLLTVYMHRANIKRLLKGEESKTNLFQRGKSK
jgi:glycerol-3-phosphate acyltransferase PlsY